LKAIFHSSWILIAGFVLCWNSGFIGAEYALRYSGPFALLFWRYVLLSVLLFVHLALRRRLKWPGWRAALTAVWVGILAHGVWLGCVLVSLRYGVPAGIVALVVALQPMTTGALSGPVVGERTPPMRWVGLAIGLTGVVVAVWARTDLTNTQSLVACWIPFGSVAAITIASLIERRLDVQQREKRLSLDEDLFYQALGTALVAAVPAWLQEGLVTDWSVEYVGALLWLVLGVSLAAYAIMWRLIERLDATRVAGLFYFGPPVTMVMGWAAFGDRLTVSDLAGLSIVAVGVLLTLMKSG
jgi:drug/metabolite transporter (DMT)-like permease